MYPAFDHILIDVPDLSAAQAEYTALLGQDAVSQFALANINIRFRQKIQLQTPQITHLAMLDPAMAGDQAPEPIAGGPRNIPLSRGHSREAAYRDIETATGIYAIDHLVLQTADADACIALFRDTMGLRLALDQNVPEWGGRMLFFRHGKMTLEVIQFSDKPPQQDFFWGITYLCRDIGKTLACLDERGIEHSPVREGRKPGTRVSTVKSHCLGLPTLLLGPA